MSEWAGVVRTCGCVFEVNPGQRHCRDGVPRGAGFNSWLAATGGFDFDNGLYFRRLEDTVAYDLGLGYVLDMVLLSR